MAKRPILEFILNLINFILMSFSFCILGYGLVCFFNWKQNPSNKSHQESNNVKYMDLRPILLAFHSSKPSSDLLPKVWFIYLVIGISALLFITTWIGFIGTSLRNPCCLLCYCVLSLALVLTEVGVTIFIFIIKQNWKESIPIDRSTLQIVYHFMYQNWSIIRWIVLAVFILQVIGLIQALYLVVVFKRKRSSYDESVTNYMQITRSPPSPTHTTK